MKKKVAIFLIKLLIVVAISGVVIHYLVGVNVFSCHFLLDIFLVFVVVFLMALFGCGIKEFFFPSE